jgi:hypothetical protein
MKRTGTVLVAVVSLIFAWGGTATAAPRPWYAYWGLGYAAPSYSGELGAAVDRMDRVAGVSRISVSADVLGYYVPVLDDRTIAGGVLNIVFDDHSKGEASVVIGSYRLAASVMHFFGRGPGSGFFLRGDFGVAGTSVDAWQGERASQLSDERGLGALVGTGYGLRVSEGFSVLFNVNYSVALAGGETHRALGIGIGGLW